MCHGLMVKRGGPEKAVSSRFDHNSERGVEVLPVRIKKRWERGVGT